MSASTPDTRRPSRGLAVLGVGALALATVLLVPTARDTGPVFVPKMVGVTLPDGRSIHVQEYEVTVAEWNRCHDAGACTLRLHPRGEGQGIDYPATGLNWFDVNEYLGWIDVGSGTFRLPTTAEWNAMARSVLPEKPAPIFTDPALRWASAYLTMPQPQRRLRPSGSFATTPEGVADLDGSVWEWTSDCYAGAEKGFGADDCPAFFVGGEHVAAIPVFTRDPARGGCAVGSPPPHLGMRLVSDRPLRGRARTFPR